MQAITKVFHTVFRQPDAAQPMQTDIILHGWRLFLARAVWLMAAGFSLFLLGKGTLFIFQLYIGPVDASQNLIPYLPTKSVTTGLKEIGFALRALVLYQNLITLLIEIGFGLTGLLIFWRRSDRFAPIYFSMMLMLFGALFFPSSSAISPATPLSTFFADLLFASFVYNLYLFPDGRLTPRWTIVPLFLIVLTSFTGAFFAGTVFDFTQSPIILLPIFLSGPLAIVLRYRRADRVQRQQIKWVALGTLVALILFLLFWDVLTLIPEFRQPGKPALFYELVAGTLQPLSFLAIPVTICFAMLRYKLWDVDYLLSRTLVYTTLTAGVIGVYVLLVQGSEELLKTQGSLGVSLFATAVIAVIFQPLRQWLQRRVNRLIYSERGEPYAVISRLGQRLEATISPDALLETIVATVRDALKIPYAAIILFQDAEKVTAAETGTPRADLVCLPLMFQQETIGELALSPNLGETFSSADLRLLADLTRQAGLAVHNVQLTEALQRARVSLVTSREEERRRLRRDLHDGLGPQLASQTLTINAITRLVEKDPKQAVALLDHLKEQSQTALSDIRTLVYNLRPPVLDDMGLLAAVRSLAGEASNGPTAIELALPETLPLLPAAVDVAAYRILQEALGNVIRHSGASQCKVSIAMDKGLNVEVQDNGRGIPIKAVRGVGLNSMRERAVEVGGTFHVESSEGEGTCIRAWLPVPEEKE